MPVGKQYLEMTYHLIATVVVLSRANEGQHFGEALCSSLLGFGIGYLIPAFTLDLLTSTTQVFALLLVIEPVRVPQKANMLIAYSRHLIYQCWTSCP